MTIFLSYISLELMSLVNPGILCPVPYLLLITIFMIVVEKCDDGEAQEKIPKLEERLSELEEELFGDASSNYIRAAEIEEEKAKIEEELLELYELVM